MFRGIERPFVPSPSHHGDELWEVPEGAENPTGWNEATEGRRSPSDLGPDRPSGEPWTAWWRGRSGPRSDGGRQTSRTQSTMDAIHG